MRIDQIDLVGAINLQTIQLSEINGQLVVQNIGQTPSQVFSATGSQGPQGPSGVGGGGTGPQGLRGPTGLAGADSVITNFGGSWQPLPTIYNIEGNWVTYGGSTWFSQPGVGPSDGVPPSPTNSNWNLFAGAALIIGTAIPLSSSSAGSKGEIRVSNGQSLYIHNGAQWLKSSMTFSTF